MRPAHHGRTPGPGTAYRQTRRLLAAPDPPDPGMGDPAGRCGDPADGPHRIRSARLGTRGDRPRLVLLGLPRRTYRRAAGLAGLPRRTHRIAGRTRLPGAGAAAAPARGHPD